MKNAPQAAKRKTLATLQPNECRWPIGDPQLPGFHFCGELKEDGQPYCATHAARASTSARPRPIGYRRGG
ncbi:MAG: GcrA family cell cycle regulator [Hyphomicrobium sp.]